MTAFYKVILNGSYKGKDNQNTLYYRTAVDPFGGTFGFGGASELAEEVLAEVVPAFLAFKPDTYLLETIQVIPRNDLFQLMFQLPYTLDVNLPGTGPGWIDNTDGPALCINIHFNLEPVLLGLQALTAPKRGYISVGPVPSEWLDDTGRLHDTYLNGVDPTLTALKTALSSNLESIDPPAVWFPVRVSEHYGQVGGGFLGWGWADIMGCSVDEYVSFRKSRRITG